ncbi:GGDEF domain-containing protein [Piscinibacter terrae]|uniref:diguanylate cyclase n=1 Tax=Piscinibacter terrae TaxID=2496871 RepID=A0A3N7HIV0_9BURK|nr:GGDEF domain-containing protein [Albitalea terrae]RQP21958.1 GGDEF domain-containing protein [Albitalea terrae]
MQPGRFNRLLLGLVALTLAALAWNEFGMNSVLAITAAQPYSIWTDDDRREAGGRTVAHVDRVGSTFVMTCDAKPGYEYPYCELAIALRAMPDGIDLTGYRFLRVWIRHEGPAMQQSVRLYLCNFTPSYSKLGDQQSLKVHEVAFDPGRAGEPVDIDIAKFSVASWWISEHNVPMDHVGTELDKVSVLRVGTGNNAPVGLHKITVDRIEFHGKLVSKATFRLAVLMAWMLGIISFVTLDAAATRRRLKAAEQGQLSLRRINAALQLKTRDYAEQAGRDPLTSLLNRRGLGDDLLKRSKEGEARLFPMSLVFVDLDHFKNINDTHGHAAGDAVLRKVAQTVGLQIQRSDLLTRWGGEEFLLLCPLTRAHEAQAIAERLRRVIESIDWEALALHVTASFGVAEAMNAADLSAGIDRADAAVYVAKRSGRNRVEVHGTKAADDGAQASVE